MNLSLITARERGGLIVYYKKNKKKKYGIEFEDSTISLTLLVSHLSKGSQS
jgi:hypothetical protein